MFFEVIIYMKNMFFIFSYLIYTIFPFREIIHVIIIKLLSPFKNEGERLRVILILVNLVNYSRVLSDISLLKGN